MTVLVQILLILDRLYRNASKLTRMRSRKMLNKFHVTIDLQADAKGVT